MKDNSKSNSDDKSSADSVADYLQTLANKEGEREQLYYSQEQEFNSDELARVINETRLNELLVQSDEFLRGLGVEIEGFED
ncbi:hypothetical protein [Psychrobacter sp. FME5]|uniref:hypothetical protein n=1 Tax=unclassified Psychrobacter TaxID=196806 RepID=UPI0017878947|nr:hypothetical protein [Psychrobacter sp. FME5]MBE0443754.1 hypothetical protein [Psychrobacter sp. FME5]MDN5802859.1 hypothetical protein [Psychrobacter sp.]MDN5892036.1 hypothetical protein [Psychrobacter sp.]MDN5897968.1 hypothetical protein [Psychrobacter sp.]